MPLLAFFPSGFEADALFDSLFEIVFELDYAEEAKDGGKNVVGEHCQRSDVLKREAIVFWLKKNEKEKQETKEKDRKGNQKDREVISW